MLFTDFQEFYSHKLRESREAGVRPGNEEKLTLRHQNPNGIKFLYIHGYAACRAEGEFIMDQVAAAYNASVYYLRLPGHGTNPEDHALSSWKDYIRTAEEAFLHMDLIPGRLILAGTSMGGALASLLASRYAHKITGLILVSPFFGFYNRFASAARWPLGTALMAAFYGAVRTPDGSKAAKSALLPGSGSFWYEKQYYQPVRNLAVLEKLIPVPDVLSRIQCPVVMFYYYKDDSHQDFSASVSRMLDTFNKMGGSSPNPKNRSIRVVNGAHVMMSRYIKSDHEFVFSKIKDFIDDII